MSDIKVDDIWVVRRDGDHLGYATGEPDDIRAYFYNAFHPYHIELSPLKVQAVPKGFAKHRQKKRLEGERDEINRKLEAL